MRAWLIFLRGFAVSSKPGAAQCAERFSRDPEMIITLMSNHVSPYCESATEGSLVRADAMEG